MSNFEKNELFKRVLLFFAPYCEFLLYKIRDSKRKGDLDHRLLSAHLGFDMWSIQDDYPLVDSNFQIDQYETRFNANIKNLKHILNKGTIEEFMPLNSIKAKDAPFW